ncbi:MAG: chemotaxis protein CheC [Haloferacaceae archaeon]
MKVDIQSLGTFNRLAQEGAEHAAASLTQMTGIETYVDVTNITLMSPSDLDDAFGGREFVGVQIGFDGGLAGETALAFDRESASTIVDVLVPGASSGESFEGMARSGVEEVGNIMVGGFVDGWADYLDTQIDITPPAYVEGTGTSVLPDGSLDRAESDHVFVIQSQMTAVDEEIDAYIYMLPEYAALVEMLEAQDADDAVPLEKLTVFNEMTRQGASQAAGNISSMTGIETEVDVSRLTFVPIEDVPNTVDDTSYVGVVMEFKGTPGGYLAILFDEPSAQTVVDALVPMETEGDGIGEMGESAIQEIGNIMTSGFIDGWANVLQTSIDHTPPELVHDLGASILSPIAGRLGQSQEYAFLMDSAVRTDDDAFQCEIYAIPDEGKLKEALDSLLVERRDQTEPDPESLFSE